MEIEQDGDHIYGQRAIWAICCMLLVGLRQPLSDQHVHLMLVNIKSLLTFFMKCMTWGYRYSIAAYEYIMSE